MEFWTEPIDKYSNAHRAFIQLLLRKNMILLEEVGPAFLKLHARHNEDDDVCLVLMHELTALQNKRLVHELMERLNRNLRVVGMRMVQFPDEARRATEYVSIVSDRVYSETMVQASGFTSDELGKFQIWLKMMYDALPENDNTPNGTASNVECHGEVPIEHLLNSRVGQLSASGAQKLLNKFISAQWLIVDENRSTLRLHPKAMAELSNGIQMEFRLPVCELCRRPIFLHRLSYVCPCGFNYHANCILKANAAAPPKCANNTCFLTEDVVDSAEFDDDVAETTRRSRVSGTQKRKRRHNASTDAELSDNEIPNHTDEMDVDMENGDDVQEEADEKEEFARPSQPVRRRTRTQPANATQTTSTSSSQTQGSSRVKREPLSQLEPSPTAQRSGRRYPSRRQPTPSANSTTLIKSEYSSSTQNTTAQVTISQDDEPTPSLRHRKRRVTNEEEEED